jgi:hypothetical protein
MPIETGILAGVGELARDLLVVQLLHHNILDLITTNPILRQWYINNQ